MTDHQFKALLYALENISITGGSGGGGDASAANQAIANARLQEVINEIKEQNVDGLGAPVITPVTAAINIAAGARRVQLIMPTAGTGTVEVEGIPYDATSPIFLEWDNIDLVGALTGNANGNTVYIREIR